MKVGVWVLFSVRHVTTKCIGKIPNAWTLSIGRVSNALCGVPRYLHAPTGDCDCATYRQQAPRIGIANVGALYLIQGFDRFEVPK